MIATFSYTPDRDTRIDFSRAYYKATGRLLVSRGSRGTVARGHQRQAGVATTERCWTDDRLAREVLPDGRARHDGRKVQRAWSSSGEPRRRTLWMWDDPALVNIASRNRNAVILEGHVPPVAVRHRNHAGQRRAQALGARTARSSMRRQDAFCQASSALALPAATCTGGDRSRRTSCGRRTPSGYSRRGTGRARARSPCRLRRALRRLDRVRGQQVDRHDVERSRVRRAEHDRGRARRRDAPRASARRTRTSGHRA